MKKSALYTVLGLLVISMLGMVSAVSAPKNVVVGGTIWNSDYTAVVEGAQIIVTCNGYNETATSNSEGNYGVEFDNSQIFKCNEGDTVIVIAIKGDLSGIESDVVNDFPLSINLVIIDVPVTPEFGAIMGLMTLLASAGIFFVVRRN